MNVTVFGIMSIVASILAFLFAGWLYTWVRKQPSSNKRIIEVGELIRNGAATFLNKEYRVLTRFAGVAAILIFIFLPSPIWMGNILKNITMAIAYIAGTVFSAVAGKIGMNITVLYDRFPRRSRYGHGCCRLKPVRGYGGIISNK